MFSAAITYDQKDIQEFRSDETVRESFRTSCALFKRERGKIKTSKEIELCFFCLVRIWPPEQSSGYHFQKINKTVATRRGCVKTTLRQICRYISRVVVRFTNASL